MSPLVSSSRAISTTRATRELTRACTLDASMAEILPRAALTGMNRRIFLCIACLRHLQTAFQLGSR